MRRTPEERILTAAWVLVVSCLLMGLANLLDRLYPGDNPWIGQGIVWFFTARWVILLLLDRPFR